MPSMPTQIDKALIVLSGKGGVGKSTLSCRLAMSLAANGGGRVGLLDVDLCGPSAPRMLGLQGHRVHQCPEGWVPVTLPVGDSAQLLVMSIGFLLADSDDPVVWRGPKKTAMVGQFVRDVHWQSLDFLVVDTPPGTSDEHMAIVESLTGLANQLKAVVITTPQAVSVGDVRRELGFCEKTRLPVAGIVENMSGFVCPNCSHCSNVFSVGGGQELARLKRLPFLGRLPLDPRVARGADDGRVGDESESDKEYDAAMRAIVDKLVRALGGGGAGDEAAAE